MSGSGSGAPGGSILIKVGNGAGDDTEDVGGELCLGRVILLQTMPQEAQ